MRSRLFAAAAAVVAVAACGDTDSVSGPAAGMTLTPMTYDCSEQTQLPVAECEALVALYGNTNGPGWTLNRGWLQTDMPCIANNTGGWDGVLCSETEPFTVLHLQLASNGLAGALPGELGGLTNLMTIYLSDNRLTGPVPAELGNLTNLEEMYLDHNQLSGAVPPELGNLRTVRIVQLDHNELNGPIPAELADMDDLAALYLDFNQLSGPIPPELGLMQSLQILALNNNRLTSPIPRELFSGQVFYVWLTWNDFSGLLPAGVAYDGDPRGCLLTPGNTGLYVPDVPLYRAADWHGDGLICGIPFTADPAIVASDIGVLLDDLVREGTLNGGRANALQKKIEQALEHLRKGRIEQADHAVRNFMRQVDRLTDTVLPSAQAAELKLRAEIMIQLM